MLNLNIDFDQIVYVNKEKKLFEYTNQLVEYRKKRDLRLKKRKKRGTLAKIKDVKKTCFNGYTEHKKEPRGFEYSDTQQTRVFYYSKDKTVRS